MSFGGFVSMSLDSIDLSVQFLIALRRKELVFVGSHDWDDTTITPMFLHKLRRLISPS